ncbi:hypothetical protein RN001_002201 [Aquatica leii]|uniref:Uncharacterized protein n=1 Tax=Aquatica leii TaxID=1421715 RepID=A0AAN7SSS8_9COLE|nr:hypothetical protein RN001_002201 [Aquatica leii]
MPYVFQPEDNLEEIHFEDWVNNFEKLVLLGWHFVFSTFSLSSIIVEIMVCSFSPGRLALFGTKNCVNFVCFIFSCSFFSFNFQHALRRTFLPCDYENSLWDEIRNRTQGDNEPVAIYIAIMENLFKRFSSVPSEITRLSVIKGNLQPYLQSQLTLQLICSISELTRTCRLLEDSQVRTNKFKPPPTKP